MNRLKISDGAYVLEREWDGEVIEGASDNLIGVFDVDTFTLIDDAYNRSVAILNCLYTDVELNGTAWSSLTALEQAFNEAIEESSGGGGKDAKDISYDNAKSGLESDNVQDAIDELSENVSLKKTPVVYVLSSTRTVFIDGVQSQTPYTDVRELLDSNKAVEFRFRDDEDAPSIDTCVLVADWSTDEDGIRLQGQYFSDGENVIVRVALLVNEEVFVQTENDEFAQKKYVDNSINSRVWTGTMKEYNALGSKNPNTVYNVMPNPDTRLKFTAVVPNSSVSYTGDNPATYNWEYSTDGKTWQPYVSGNVISLANVGDYAMFRGNGCIGSQSTHFNMTGKIAASGSVMSLIDGNGMSIDMKTNTFQYLFYGCRSLITAPELPATTLSQRCYQNMFEGCTSLTTAPELPAIDITTFCYRSMFSGCTSLTTAPELPAPYLQTYCYFGMFSGCTSLTTAPEIKANNLNSTSCSWMFNNCSSLTKATTYADNWSTKNAEGWLNGVAPTGVVRCKQSANIPLNTPNGIPEGWTVEYID